MHEVPVKSHLPGQFLIPPKGNYEAIILAGGLGTRLRSVVPELPKCMAMVAGRPFLFYVINYLRSEGVGTFIFSLGYKHEIIEQYLQEQFATLRYKVIIEKEPMGTGGAARMACLEATENNVILANGDTLFRITVDELMDFHLSRDAACTLSLKPMKDFSRYGMVELNDDFSIKNFREKKYYSSGLINGGLYVINVPDFLSLGLPEKFSFETDYLEKLVQFLSEKKSGEQRPSIFGLVQDRYFIDIGVPEDFMQAQLDFQHISLDLKAITREWTLFLDRDGVINHEKNESYVLHPNEFLLFDGVPEAFRKFAGKFGRIIVVTNQRGVGRGLMTEDDLAAVHDKMIQLVKGENVVIDQVYFDISLDNFSTGRKPNPGMAAVARKEFPDIDLTRSIMVGNNHSDMLFGKNAGMYTVFVRTTRPDQAFPHPDIDLAFDSLVDFARAL